MLDSYFQEIQQRRRRKNFFWILVFILTIFLFFFFQGKYISLQVNWKNILSASGNTLPSEPNFQINSFGVITVKTIPSDASITINDQSHYSDEKVWKNYGTYSISIKKDGYIGGNMTANLDSTKNFYMDEVFLLPNPEYEKIPNFPSSNIYSVGKNTWIAQDGGKMTLYKNNFESGTEIFSGTGLIHIGEGKFLSGKTIQEYSLVEKKWNPLKITGIDTYITNCKKQEQTISYSFGIFSCGNTGDIFTVGGDTVTGTVLVGKNSIQTHDALILGDRVQGDLSVFPLYKQEKTKSFSGLENIPATNHDILLIQQEYIVNPSDLWVPLYNTWYTASGGLLIPIETIQTENNSTHETSTTIDTTLETLTFAEVVGKTLVVIGTKEEQKYISLIDTSKSTEPARILLLPDIPLEDVRIYENRGNYFLKTQGTLLFFYAKGEEIMWIIAGKILAFGDTFALYEQDDAIWRADWKGPEIRSR